MQKKQSSLFTFFNKPPGSNTVTPPKSDQTSILSKGAIEQSLVNTRMVQNVLLIWLDNNIDLDNSNDCRNTVAQLRRVVNTVKTFSNSN